MGFTFRARASFRVVSSLAIREPLSSSAIVERLTPERLINTQLEGLLTHLENGKHLTIYDRVEAAKATSALIMAARLEGGEPVDISVVRERFSSIEDALAMLQEESAEAEEH